MLLSQHLFQKRQDPLNVDDCRPISLVSCIHKIISKILANRLKSMLPKIIDCSQSAFIKGKGLLDSIMVANEVVEECRLKKKRLAIVKVDYEKVYDLVSQDFLYYMLFRLGFCASGLGGLKNAWNHRLYRYWLMEALPRSSSLQGAQARRSYETFPIPSSCGRPNMASQISCQEKLLLWCRSGF